MNQVMGLIKSFVMKVSPVQPYTLGTLQFYLIAHIIIVVVIANVKLVQIYFKKKKKDKTNI